MYDKIIKSHQNLYREQAARLVNIFKLKFSQCDGRQYPQIISALNAIYKQEHTDEQLLEMITDGDGDGGLADAYIFTIDSVDIFDFKEKDNLGLRQIQQLRSRLEELIIRKPGSFEACDIRRIKKHLKKFHAPQNDRAVINIYIIRNKFTTPSQEIQNEIEKMKKHGVEIILLSNKEIVKILLEQDFLKSWYLKKANVEVLSEDPVDGEISKKFNHLIIKLPIKELLSLYYEHEEKGNDLFAQNIRLPQNQENFKTDLSGTIENCTENFFLLHNGITITASGITADARKFIINEPQVVNGAQTLGNLFRHYKNNLDYNKLKKAKVLCKIIKAKSDFTDLICETSNTQKAVGVEQLRTNDFFQKELELYIKCESNGKYEYVRKGKKKDKSSITVKYAKFFQWVYAALFYKPADAKNAKKNLFEKDERGEYENIKEKIKTNLSRIIFLCEVGSFVENQIKKEINKETKSMLRSADLHIIAALFKLRSLKVSDFRKVSRIMSDYSREQIKADPNLNNNKIFTKTEETWKLLNDKI